MLIRIEDTPRYLAKELTEASDHIERAVEVLNRNPEAQACAFGLIATKLAGSMAAGSVTIDQLPDALKALHDIFVIEFCRELYERGDISKESFAYQLDKYKVRVSKSDFNVLLRTVARDHGGMN